MRHLFFIIIFSSVITLSGCFDDHGHSHDSPEQTHEDSNSHDSIDN